jgi:hypothetical protein
MTFHIIFIEKIKSPVCHWKILHVYDYLIFSEIRLAKKSYTINHIFILISPFCNLLMKDRIRYKLSQKVGLLQALIFTCKIFQFSQKVNPFEMGQFQSLNFKVRSFDNKFNQKSFLSLNPK